MYEPYNCQSGVDAETEADEDESWWDGYCVGEDDKDDNEETLVEDVSGRVITGHVWKSCRP